MQAKEMLFLELGCIPFREIIRERRLGFLHYILNLDPKSMMYRFFKSQMENHMGLGDNSFGGFETFEIRTFKYGGHQKNEEGCFYENN